MGHHQQTLHRLRRSSARHLGPVTGCTQWRFVAGKISELNGELWISIAMFDYPYYPFIIIPYLHYINVHCLFSTPSFHTHRLSHPGYQIHLFYISLTTFTILIHAFVGSWSLTINEPRQLSLLLDLDAAIGSRSESTAHGQVLHLNHWSSVVTPLVMSK